MAATVLDASSSNTATSCSNTLAGSRATPAEDVLQDALLRALRAYPRLEHAEHLRAWLYRVTTSAAIDHHRSPQARGHHRRPAHRGHPRHLRRRRVRGADRAAQRHGARPRCGCGSSTTSTTTGSPSASAARRSPPASASPPPSAPSGRATHDPPARIAARVRRRRRGARGPRRRHLHPPAHARSAGCSSSRARRPRRDRLRERVRGPRARRGRGRARPARDRLRPRAGEDARRAVGATSRATRPRSSCRSTCASRTRRSGARARARCAGAARRDGLLRRARRPRRQPEGRPRRRQACARNPVPIVVPCHRVLPGHRQARQLRRRARSARRAAELEGASRTR